MQTKDKQNLGEIQSRGLEVFEKASPLFKILVAKCVVTYLAICVRSRTEEDYSELAQLLEDILSYQRDFLPAVNKEKEQTKKKT